MPPSVPPASYHSQLARAADHLLACFALLFGLASLGLSWWTGQWTVFALITLPSLLALGFILRTWPGSMLSRNTMALVLMALEAAMIQQTHGLVEIHFGVFIVIALLLYYRDWVPVAVAAAAIAVHHVSFFWMQTAGLPIRLFVPGSGIGILVLHATYVVVEAGFIILMAVQLRK